MKFCSTIVFVITMVISCSADAQMGGFGGGGVGGGGHLYPDLYAGDVYELSDPDANGVALIFRDDEEDYPTILFTDESDFYSSIDFEEDIWSTFFPLGVNLTFELQNEFGYPITRKFVFEPASNQFLFESATEASLFAGFNPISSALAYFGTFGEADKPVKHVIGWVYTVWHDLDKDGVLDPNEPVYVGSTESPDRLDCTQGGHNHADFFFPIDKTIVVDLEITPVLGDPNGTDNTRVVEYYESQTILDLPHSPASDDPLSDGKDDDGLIQRYPLIINVAWPFKPGTDEHNGFPGTHSGTGIGSPVPTDGIYGGGVIPSEEHPIPEIGGTYGS
jgi:hypothetical protein